MNDNEKVDKTRRNLVVATSVVGGAAGVGAAVPFVASMWPSERARAAGAPVEVDVSRIAPGELGVIEWRGKPVWVLRRTKEMIASLKVVEPRLSDPLSQASDQPKYAENGYRSANPEVLVRERGGKQYWSEPEILEGAEYDRIWPMLNADRAWYDNYQAKTDRKIPLVRLSETRPA